MNNKKIKLTLDYSNFENNQNLFNEIIKCLSHKKEK